MLDRMSRIAVKKTHKLYIGGKFPRAESGRYYPLYNHEGELLANVSTASRKDFREAVVAARKAFKGWRGASAFLRSQILYRSAEILEGRRAQFVSELISMEALPSDAELEVDACIDLLVYYAGWCDKYQQLFSSVNPVASPHFNFSVPEPTGVVSVVAPSSSTAQPLLGLCSTMAPVIAGGNTCVILADQESSLCATSLAEVLNTSDFPAGVVNILTGDRKDLLEVMASHMDVNAMLLCTDSREERKWVQTLAADHILRVVLQPNQAPDKSPYLIHDFQEIKTTWHPVGC